MNDEKSIEKLNMGELWSLAKTRGISIKGKKRKDLIKELIASDSSKSEPTKEESVQVEPKEKPVKKNEKITFVEATLADGTRIKVPAKDVEPIKADKEKNIVTIKSVDGRELEASVGRLHWMGKEIEVPLEMEEEVRRLLKLGGFYFI